MADALLSDLPQLRPVLGFNPQASGRLQQGNQVKTITALTAKRLGKFLAKDIRQLFGSAQQDRAERLGSLAQSTIECLGRSDALYHNLEHTMLVTIVGRDIL